VLDPHPELPALARPAQRKATLGRRAARLGAGLTLLAAGLTCLLAIGVDVGPVALVTGLVLATLPVPLYVFVALRVDRFEPEPARLLAWAFFWGASAATLIALVLNSAGQALVGANFGSHIGELYGASVSAPVVEEGAKGAVLFAIYRWGRHHFDGMLDGLVYAAMVGLGFAMTENVLYYGSAALEGGVPLAVTFFVRGVMAPFVHPVFTALTGLGLGLAAQSRPGARRWLAPAGGLVGAIFLHSLWNTSASVAGGAAFVGVFFTIMVPLFAGLIGLVAVARRHEGRLIATGLEPEVEAGVLSRGDVLVLSALHERRRLLRAARREGRTMRRVCREWVETATELAFLRDRRRRATISTAAGDQIGEPQLLARLRELRGSLGAGADAVSRAAGERAARVAALAATPAGWYADPWRQATWRWWDGTAWTGHLAR